MDRRPAAPPRAAGRSLDGLAAWLRRYYTPLGDTDHGASQRQPLSGDGRTLT